MIFNFHSGSGSCFFTHPGSQIPDPGSRGQKRTGSRITNPDPGSATLEGTVLLYTKKLELEPSL
jgi:hypothetical protein